MSLTKATLESEIRKVIDPTYAGFVGFSDNPDETLRRADAASKWATAFDNYGQSVQNVNGDAALSGPNRAGFESALSFATLTEAESASEFGSAWSAYWTGLSFTPGVPSAINASVECPNVGGNLIFGIIASSLVTVVNSVPLIATLTGIFAEKSIEPAAKATALADALHNASISNVTVLTSGTDTSGPPVAITNTCRLF